jgi:protein-disulfide isomerase
MISFRFLDYPLPAHLNTWDASMAAACANEQGKFWEMHDQIFANQDRWNTQATRRPKAVLAPLASSIGLDMTRWNECYDTQKYRLAIAAHLKEGENRLVRSTPTFIIGSRMVPGAIGYDVFKAYVDSALTEKATAGTNGSR